jgi:hypothetical protein
LRENNIKTVKEFLAIKDWDHVTKINDRTRREFKSMSDAFRTNFQAINYDSGVLCTFQFNVEKMENGKNYLQLCSITNGTSQLHLCNIRVVVYDKSQFTLRLQSTEANGLMYEVTLRMNLATFAKILSRIYKLVQMRQTVHTTGSHTRPCIATPKRSTRGRGGGGCTRKS